MYGRIDGTINCAGDGDSLEPGWRHSGFRLKPQPRPLLHDGALLHQGIEKSKEHPQRQLQDRAHGAGQDQRLHHLTKGAFEPDARVGTSYLKDGIRVNAVVPAESWTRSGTVGGLFPPGGKSWKPSSATSPLGADDHGGGTGGLAVPAFAAVNVYHDQWVVVDGDYTHRPYLGWPLRRCAVGRITSPHAARRLSSSPRCFHVGLSCRLIDVLNKHFQVTLNVSRPSPVNFRPT